MKNENKDEKKDKKGFKLSYIFTRETLGMTILLFCGIIFLTLLTGKGIFGPLGSAICTFMYGTFGYGAFLLLISLAYLGFWLVFEKSLKIKVKPALAFALSVFIFFLLFHAVSTRGYTLTGYGAYIRDCYVNARNGFSGYTFGGVISAIFVFPFAKLTTFIGAYVIFSILLIASGYLDFVVIRRSFGKKQSGVLAIDRSGEEQEEVAQVHAAEKVDLIEPEEESAPVESATQQPVYSSDGFTQQLAPQSVQPNPQDAAEEGEDDDRFSRKNLGRKILFENGEFAAESYRRNMIFDESSYFHNPIISEGDYLNSFSSGKSNAVPEDKTYSQSYQDDVLNSPVKSVPSNYVYGEKPVESLDEPNGGYSIDRNSPVLDSPAEPVRESDSYSEVIRPFDEPVRGQTAERVPDPEESTPFEEVDEPADNADFTEPVRGESDEKTEDYGRIINDRPVQESGRGSIFNIFNADNPRASENRVQPDSSRISSRAERSASLFEDNRGNDEDDLFSETAKPVAEPQSPTTKPDIPETPPVSPLLGDRRERRVSPEPIRPAPAPAEQPKEEEKPKHVWKKYIRPTLDLLDDYPENSNVNTGEIDDNKRSIVETLDRFKISSEVSNVVIGPAITRYDVVIEDKTNIKRALNYREAIAMALMKDNVNVYLNYSKGALSIEVPNNNRSIVGLKTILTSQKFINAKQNSLSFALGKNVEGEVVCPDITKMPHLLVAGTTGSGKSICLSALLISLLYKYGPEELRLILVDPKQVEFISYDKLPHLMINEIIYEVDKAIKALNWANKEMERRYTLFKDMTEKGIATKNLDEYNAHLPEGEEKLPKIVIILDEFGDLMLQAKKDIESRIIKLVQKARACGIHLVLATQRPSVDCITGLIKSNLPTRIGFKVNSFDDSRTIFDIGGAEKLLGKGDMYFRSADNPDLARIQGCFIDTHEVQNVTDFIKANNETYFDQSVSDFINTVEEDTSAGNSSNTGGDGGSDGDMKIDETFIKALKFCVVSNQASVSMIQRRFPVGYIKACKIIDWMENMNYVTQSEGSKPRKVLMTQDEFFNIYGEVDD